MAELWVGVAVVVATAVPSVALVVRKLLDVRMMRRNRELVLSFAGSDARLSGGDFPSESTEGLIHLLEAVDAGEKAARGHSHVQELNELRPGPAMGQVVRPRTSRENEAHRSSVIADSEFHDGPTR